MVGSPKLLTLFAPIRLVVRPLLGVALFAGISAWAQNAPASPAANQNKDERKTYVVNNGTTTYSRTEESSRRKTADGEVETQRVRMPAYAGDESVLAEREIRTRRLPDGSVEKEYVLKNPDGSGKLGPIEIIREKSKTTRDSTAVERETLKPDSEGHWSATRKESITEKGPDGARQSVREVREPSVAGGWQVTERQTTRTKTAGAAKESHSVKEVPDSYGRLSEYEIKEERSTKAEDKEVGEVTVRRRDFQDTDNNKFYLLEKTTSEQRKTADGKTIVSSTTESDLVAGDATRNTESHHPEVVEQRRVEISVQGGVQQKVTTVKERGTVDPRLRPSYQVIQQTDQNGNVRQIFIPDK